jgi:hypothetical protein
MFGSMRYWFSSAHATMSVAKEAAKKRRCHGDSARVVKSVRRGEEESVRR